MSPPTCNTKHWPPQWPKGPESTGSLLLLYTEKPLSCPARSVWSIGRCSEVWTGRCEFILLHLFRSVRDSVRWFIDRPGIYVGALLPGMLLFWLSRNRGIIIGKGTSCLKAGPRGERRCNLRACVRQTQTQSACTHTHAHTQKRARVHTHIHKSACAHTHTHTSARVHTYTHTSARVHTHTSPTHSPPEKKKNKDTHKTCDSNVHHRPSRHGCRWSYMYQRQQHNSVHTLTTERLLVPKETERKKWRKPKQLQAIQTRQWRVRYALREFISPGSLGIDTNRWEGWGGVGMWGGVGRGVRWRRRRRKTALILYHSVPVRVSHIARWRIQLTPRDPTYSKATYSFVQTSLKATGLEHTSWHHKRWSVLCGNRSFDYFKWSVLCGNRSFDYLKSTRPFCYGRRKTVGFSQQH